MVEMPGVAPAVVPSGWLGAGVLPWTPVLVSGVAVVSDGVVRGSSEAAVGAGAVGGGMVGVLPGPGDVLDLSGVEAPVSGVEVPVSGLEEGTVAAVVEVLMGSSAEVSIGVEEVG